MGTSLPARKGILLTGIVLGLMIFAAGLALAGRFLPEWREGKPAPERVFRERFGELAARGGFVLGAGRPRVRLVTPVAYENEPSRPEGEQASRWLLATRTAVRVEVSQEARHPDKGKAGRLIFTFSLDGRPQQFLWVPRDLRSMFLPSDQKADVDRAIRLSSLVLAPGETLGTPRIDSFGNSVRLMIPIAGSAPPQHLLILASPTVSAAREHGGMTMRAVARSQAQFDRALGIAARNLLAFLGVLGLFLALAVQERIGVANGALLALGALLTLPPVATPSLWSPAFAIAFVAVGALWTFLLWSSAESLLRSTDGELHHQPRRPAGGPAGTARRPGPARRLRLRSRHRRPRSRPARRWPSPCRGSGRRRRASRCPFSGRRAARWRTASSLRAGGARHRPGAALAAVALGARRRRDRRRRPAGPGRHPSVARAGWRRKPLSAALLVCVCRRHGLTALLTAAVVSKLLPLAVFAGRYLDWMPGAFAATARGSPPPSWLSASRAFSVRRPRSSQRLRAAGVRSPDGGGAAGAARDGSARPHAARTAAADAATPRRAGRSRPTRSIATEAGGDLYDFISDEDGYVLARGRRRGRPRLLLRHRPGDDQGRPRQPHPPGPHAGRGPHPVRRRAARAGRLAQLHHASPCCASTPPPARPC